LQYAIHTICAKFAVIDSLATIQVFDRGIAGHSVGSSVPRAYLTELGSPRRCVLGTADIIVSLGTDLAQFPTDIVADRRFAKFILGEFCGTHTPRFAVFWWLISSNSDYQ